MPEVRNVRIDQSYAKFVKMLQMGIPKEAVRQRMRVDGLNPDLLDGVKPDEPRAPVRNDVAFAKFFKMLQVVRYSDGSGQAKMRFQGVDPEILYAPGASYEQPRKTAIFARKYLKMFDVGVPAEAVLQIMKLEGLDISDLTTLVPSRLDDRALRGYLKMLSVGVPPEAVKQNIKLQGTARNMPYKDDKQDRKFPEMLRVGVPMEAVKQKMKLERMSSDLIHAFFMPIALDEKYRKMVDVGVPVAAVEQKMVLEGHNPDTLGVADITFRPVQGSSTKKRSSADDRQDPSVKRTKTLDAE